MDYGLFVGEFVRGGEVVERGGVGRGYGDG